MFNFNLYIYLLLIYMTFIILYVKSFFMALIMFSMVPVPRIMWDNKTIKYVLLSLPLVGFASGLVWYVFVNIIEFFSLPPFIIISLVMLCPYIFNGFIHANGFMDVNNAILSSKEKEKKLKILKASNVGGFSVLSIMSLFIIVYPSIYYIYSYKEYFLMFIFIPIFSRCFSSLSVYIMNPIFEGGFASVLKKDSGIFNIIFIIIMTVIFACLAYLTCSTFAIIIFIIELLMFSLSLLYAYKNFGGISADIMGYTITISEASALLAWAIIVFEGLL